MTDDFTIPSEQSTAMSSELVGELVLLRPLSGEETMMETSVGSNIARFVEALIVVDGDARPPKYRNLGETPIFWQVVRRQLNDANPWIAGVIEKTEGGRAFRITPPEPDKIDAIRAVLKQHKDAPIPVEKIETDQSEDAPF
jgi:hypothetical protein